MNPIAFVPHTRELFLIEPSPGSSFGDDLEAGTAPLLNRLRALGWPTPARIYMTGSETAWRSARGVLIELIDALPVLGSAQPTGHPALDALCAMAQLALRLVQEGRLVPRLRGCGATATTGPRRFEARWQGVLATAAERAEVQRLGSLLQPLVAIPEGMRLEPRPRSLSGARMVQRLLDDCADLLVREACRRGAMVRLGGTPASAWEQRLVRALADDRGHFVCDPADGVALMAELNAWTSDTLSPQALPLLASPATWRAPEPLLGVMRRMLTPAARLADALRSGRPAPRTLFIAAAPASAEPIQDPLLSLTLGPTPGQTLQSARAALAASDGSLRRAA